MVGYGICASSTHLDRCGGGLSYRIRGGTILYNHYIEFNFFGVHIYNCPLKDAVANHMETVSLMGLSILSLIMLGWPATSATLPLGVQIAVTLLVILLIVIGLLVVAGATIIQALA